MGKASKSRAREKRRQQKRAVKEQRKAMYKTWADAGENKKSKRFLSRTKVRTAPRTSHPQGRCGNAGCDPCRGRGPCHRSRLACNCPAEHRKAA